MDFRVLWDYWPELLHGILVTLGLDIAVLVFGTLLAVGVALGRLSSSRLISGAFGIYSLLLRGIPGLVVLYLSYFALPQIGIRLDAYVAAIAAMSITASAYAGEVFRGGIMAINPGQYQAARSLGMSWPHMMRRIILPQAIRVVLPPYMSQAVDMTKATSLASVIAITELTGIGYELVNRTYQPFEILSFVMVIYLAIASVIIGLQAYLERRWRLRY